MKQPRRALAPLITLLLLLVPSGVWGQEADVAEFGLDSLLAMTTATASGYVQRSRDIPVASSVITSDEIRSMGYETLAEVLRTVPGLVDSNDRNYTSVGVRGLGRPSDYNSRILLLVDGDPVREHVFGSAPVGWDFALPMDRVDRVEVVRGPGSVAYGASAMLAVVNVITSPGPDGRGWSGTIQAQAPTGGRVSGGFRHAGAPDEFRADVHLSVGGNRGNDLFFSEFAEPGVSDGVYRDGDGESHLGVYVNAGLKDVSLRAGYLDRTKGVPTASFGSDFNDPRAETRDRFAWVQLGYERPVTDRLSLRMASGVQLGYADGVYPYDDEPWVEEANSGSLGVSGQLVWDPTPRLRVVAGGDLTSNTTARYVLTDPAGNGIDIADPHDLVGGYLQTLVYASPSTVVTAGVRLDRTRTVSGEVSPRVGVVQYLGPHSIWASYSSGFRAPSMYEAEYLDEDEGHYPTPGLREERAHGLEAGASIRLNGEMQIELSAYQYDLDGLIDLAPPPTDPDQTTYLNLSDIHAWGVETELVRRGSWVNARARYAFQRARTDDLRIPNSPEQILGVALWKGLGSWVFGTEIRGLSGRLTREGTDLGWSGVWDARVEFNIGSGVSVGLRGLDLLNSEGATPAGAEHEQESLPALGRRLQLGLRLGS